MTMKQTIEERAEIKNPNDVTKTDDLYEVGLYYGFEDGYIQGATEQKQIEFERAKQAFTKVCGWMEPPRFVALFDEFIDELEKTE